MFGRKKAERDAASIAIIDDRIEQKLKKFNESGESTFTYI